MVVLRTEKGDAMVAGIGEACSDDLHRVSCTCCNLVFLSRKIGNEVNDYEGMPGIFVHGSAGCSGHASRTYVSLA